MDDPRLEVYNSRGSVQIKDGYRPFVLRKAGGLYGRDFKGIPWHAGYYFDIDVSEFTAPLFFYRATSREQSITHRVITLNGRRVIRIFKEDSTGKGVNTDGWKNQRTQYYIFDRYSAPDTGGAGLRIYHKDTGVLIFSSTWKFMDVVGKFNTVETYGVYYSGGSTWVSLNSNGAVSTGRDSSSLAVTIDGPRIHMFCMGASSPSSITTRSEGAILSGDKLRFTLIESVVNRTPKYYKNVNKMANETPATAIVINTSHLPNNM